MSIINTLKRHTGLAETSLKGVENTNATYEAADHLLIIRTENGSIIHITPEIGKQLIEIIVKELL